MASKRRRSLARFAAAAALTPVVTHSVRAANDVWGLGSNNTPNGTWSDPGQWSTNTVPGAADYALFNGIGFTANPYTVAIITAESANGVLIDYDNADFNLASGAQLSVGSGNFVVANNSGNSGPSAQFALTGGGTLSVNGDADFGLFGGTGTASITGANTTLNNTGGLYVGGYNSPSNGSSFANGYLTIANGGRATGSSGVVIGYYGGNGTATVDGNASQLTTPGAVFVGRGYSSNEAPSAGTLTIQNSGQVISGNLIGVGWYGGTGTLNLHNGSLTATQLFVGSEANTTASNALEPGVGTLIASSGTITTGGTIIGYQNGIGTVSTGSGVTWTNTGSFNIGGDGSGNSSGNGFGTLSIGIGATLNNGGLLNVFSGGHLLVGGGSLTTQSFNESGGFAFSGGTINAGSFTGGDSIVAGWNGGTLNVTGSDLTIGVSGNIDVPVALNSGMSLLVSGAGHSLNVSGTLSIGTGASVNNTGLLNVFPGGHLLVNGGSLTTQSFNESGGFSLTSGTINTGSFTGGDAIVAGWNGGTFNVASSDLTIGLSGNIDVPVTLNSSMSLGVSGTTTIAADGTVIVNGGTFSAGNITIANGGTFEYLGGSVTIANNPNFVASLVASNGGTLSAGQTVGTSGSFTPASANTTIAGGSLNVGGGLQVNTSTAVTIDAGAVTAGSVNLSGGTVTLNGGNLTTGSIAGTGTLNFTSGTLTLTSATTPLNVGVNQTVGAQLTVGSSSALNAAGPIAVTSAGILANSGAIVAASASIGTAGTGTFSQTAGSTTINGVLAAGNTGTLTSGSGSGSINISGGILYAATVLLGSTAGGSGVMTVSGSGSVTIGGGAHLNDLTVNGGSVTVLDQTPPAGEDPELNRALVGGYLSNGALYVNGGNVTSPDIKLGLTQGYTGTFAQTAGTVNVGTLAVGNDAVLTSGSGTGVATVSGGSLMVNTLLLGSTAGGSGALTVSGTGSVTIGGGAHLNDLTVNAGSVTVLDQTPPAAEDPELNRALVGGYLTNGGLYVNGGTVTSPNLKFGITSGYTGTFDQTAGTTDVGILALGDDASLTSGAGTGVGTISGGSVNGNTLLLGSTVGGGGDLTVSGTGVLTLAGGAHLNDLNVAGGSVTVQDQNPPTGEDPELNRAIVGGYLTNGALNVSGGTVTTPYIKLGVTKTFTGTLNQTGGTIKVTTLSVGADTSSSTGQGMGIANFTGGSATIANLIVGSTAGGVGSVNISSSASLSLTSTVTFTAGTINFENASIALPSGTTTVGNGTLSANLHLHNATVSGSGTTLAIAANATLGGGSAMAGEAVGTALFSGANLAFSGSSSTFYMAIGGPPTDSNGNSNGGVTFDQLTVSNRSVFSAGGATVEILPLSGVVLNVPYPVVVTNSGGTIDPSTFSTITTVDPSYPYAASYTVIVDPVDGDIDVLFSSVPEPTGCTLALGTGCLLLRRRRARQLGSAKRVSLTSL